MVKIIWTTPEGVVKSAGMSRGLLTTDQYQGDPEAFSAAVLAEWFSRLSRMGLNADVMQPHIEVAERLYDLYSKYWTLDEATRETATNQVLIKLMQTGSVKDGEVALKRVELAQKGRDVPDLDHLFNNRGPSI
jgi:hypothetical protein